MSSEALRETLVKYGFEYNKPEFDAIKAQVNHLTSLVQKSGKAVDSVGKGDGKGGGFLSWATGLKAVAAAVAGNEILGFLNRTAEAGDAIGDTSDQLGLSTESLQAWQYAAQLASADAEDFVGGLRKLNLALAGGKGGDGTGVAFFKRLKIETRDAQGNIKSLDDLLPEIADAFTGFTSKTEAAAAAAQIFGKSGAKLAPLLMRGAEGVAELRREFADLGGGLSPEAIQAASDYKDAITRADVALRGLKSLLITGVLPALSSGVETLTKAAARTKEWLKETTAVETAIKGVAVAAAVTLATALAPYLLPGLKFLALFLAVDDFIAFIQGKDSVIGAILTGWFGPDTTAEIRGFFQGIGVIAEGTITGIGALWGMLTAKTEAEHDAQTASFLRATQNMSASFDNWFDSVAIVIGNVSSAWYGMIAGLELAWNGFIAGIADKTPDWIKKTLVKTASLDASGAVRNQAVAQATVQGLRDNINARRDTAVTGGAPINVTGTAPLKAPVTTTNWVEVNAPVNVTLPAGVSGQQARSLARDAARGALDGHRAALQSLEQRGGK